MRILAVDTATEVCGIGLSADGQSRLELVFSRGMTHTKVLMEGIHTILSLAKWEPTELDALAVTRGPGSFTGLRIGISTMKGIARSLDKPLVGVSSLEVLARQAPQGQPLVCPMIDARRKEVYWSLYRQSEDGLMQTHPEQAGSAIDALDQVDGRCLFIGNGAVLYAPVINRQRQDAVFMGETELNAPRPSIVAVLARELMAKGLCEDIALFKPVYLRKSDAEQMRRDTSA